MEDINNGTFLPEYNSASKKLKNQKNYDAMNSEIYSSKNKSSILCQESLIPTRDVMAEEFNNANYMFSLNYEKNNELSPTRLKNQKRLQYIKMGLMEKKKRNTRKSYQISSEINNVLDLTKTTNIEDKQENSFDLDQKKNLKDLQIVVPKGQEREVWSEIHDSLTFHEDLKKFTRSNINFLVIYIYI